MATIKKIENSMEEHFYALWDSVLNQFEPIFCCSKRDLKYAMVSLANDISSKYYYNLDDYVLFDLGVFDRKQPIIEKGKINQIGFLSEYRDENRRNIQYITQTLNFTPDGYHKKSADELKDIQEKIDNAVKDYVDKVISPTLNNSISKEIEHS